MKKLSYFLITGLIVVGFASSAIAQNDKSKRPSPPKTASASVGDLNIVVDYGAPSVKGRKIFGSGSESLEKYGKVWRTGANEATTFSVNKDVTINGESLPAGKYALFTIPEESAWTVIFNKKSDQWGAYDYNSDEDALRIKVNPEKSADVTEQLQFEVGEDGKVVFAWEHITFDFMVSAK
jgi:hypothetical protein